MARTQGSFAAQTGPRVRAAALTLFARQGYAAVSMRQIAAEVGMQVGGLYNYVSDKQSLLMDLLTVHMEELLAALEAEPRPADPVAALERFTRFHLRFHSARPDEVFISYMELRNLTEENFATLEAMRARYEAHLEAILCAGQAAEAFQITDARVSTRALIAMLTGVTTWYRPGGKLTLAELEEIYCALVLGAVGGRP